MRRNGLIAVGGSNYSRLSCHEYDFDRGEHLSLALDTNRSFVANVACASGALCSVDRANFARVR